MRVYLNAGKFRDQGEFKPWLYRIALNLARDHARKQARQLATRIDFAAEIASKSPSSDDELSLQEESERVRQALSELPEQLREVVVLRHYEALSFEAMARLLEVPATTLKSRFQVAMKRLEQQLVEMMSFSATGQEPVKPPKTASQQAAAELTEDIEVLRLLLNQSLNIGSAKAQLLKVPQGAFKNWAQIERSTGLSVTCLQCHASIDEKWLSESVLPRSKTDWETTRDALRGVNQPAPTPGTIAS